MSSFRMCMGALAVAVGMAPIVMAASANGAEAIAGNARKSGVIAAGADSEQQGPCATYVLDFWTVHSLCRGSALPPGKTGHQAVLECANTRDPSQRGTFYGPVVRGDQRSVVKCNPAEAPWHSGRHFVKLYP